jgi:hypothetical protein
VPVQLRSNLLSESEVMLQLCDGIAIKAKIVPWAQSIGQVLLFIARVIGRSSS